MALLQELELVAAQIGCAVAWSEIEERPELYELYKPGDLGNLGFRIDTLDGLAWWLTYAAKDAVTGLVSNQVVADAAADYAKRLADGGGFVPAPKR